MAKKGFRCGQFFRSEFGPDPILVAKGAQAALSRDTGTSQDENGVVRNEFSFLVHLQLHLADFQQVLDFVNWMNRMLISISFDQPLGKRECNG